MSGRRSALKRALWILSSIVVLCGLAWPKVAPLLARRAVARPADASAAPLAIPRPAAAGGAPLQVATLILKPRNYAETITSTGTLRAEEGVELQAETSGKIVQIDFAEGTAVRKGKLLLKLNDSDLRANLERFQYQQQLAEVREQRYATLLAKGVVTQQDYDNMRGDVSVQRAQVELYRAQIEKTEIRAPFDGVVGLRYVSDGAYVNAATRIATLQQIDHLKIDFAVSERFSGRVRVGSAISFTVAGGLRRYTARIFAIDPRIDAATRTVLLRALCDNADRSLLPGAFANVSIQLDALSDALLVPSEAVVPGLDEKNVYVIDHGLAERRTVELGSRTATEVHIVNGLKAGDEVILSGLQQLRDGQRVAALAGSG